MNNAKDKGSDILLFWWTLPFNNLAACTLVVCLWMYPLCLGLMLVGLYVVFWTVLYVSVLYEIFKNWNGGKKNEFKKKLILKEMYIL